MLSLYARLAAAAAAAVYISGLGWKAYRTGQDGVRAEWAADIAQRTAAALEASEQARKTESELQAKVGRVDLAYQNQKRATATVVSAVAVGMQQLETALAAAPSPAASGAAPSCRTDGARTVERELLGQCASQLARMGAEADGLAARVLGLQDYIRAIQPKP